MNGKGDTPRNCYTDQYRENYDRIFRGVTRTKLPLLHEQPRPVRYASGSRTGTRKATPGQAATTGTRHR